MVQSLRLIPLLIKQLSQFGQYATVGGAYTDDVHQPLNRLLRIFPKLIYGASELRAVVERQDRGGINHVLTEGYRLANWYMTSALFLRMA